MFIQFAFAFFDMALNACQSPLCHDNYPIWFYLISINLCQNQANIWNTWYYELVYIYKTKIRFHQCHRVPLVPRLTSSGDTRHFDNYEELPDDYFHSDPNVVHHWQEFKDFWDSLLSLFFFIYLSISFSHTITHARLRLQFLRPRASTNRIASVFFQNTE